MKRGFTLVELSIVLVIIGLLIGGILVAQSMINTARVQATIRQLGQFDAAVSNFQTNYGGLPGDIPTVMTSSVWMSGMAQGKADRDGILLSYAGDTIIFSGEIGSFWNALSLAGLSTSGNGTAGTVYVQSSNNPAANLVTTGATANIPKISAGKTAGLVAFGDAATKTNWYGLVSTEQYTSSAFIDSTAINAALKPVDALAIDTKIDNGIANSGNVLGGDTTSASGISTAVNAFCSAGGAAYNTSTSTEACVLAVRIGTQTGTLY